MPLVIGITGAIATGKSLAVQTLVDMGAVHCDVDRLVHRMYDPGKPAFDRIVAIFGGEIVGDDGYINRRILGPKVFGKPEELARLTEAIGDMTSEVRKVVEGWRNTLDGSQTAVLEAVNYVERGHGQWCDVTWLIATDEGTARQRLMVRNDLSREQADQRLASQVPWQRREPAADLVIHNDGTQEELVARIKAEFDLARRLFEQNRLPHSRYHDWWRENATY